MHRPWTLAVAMAATALAAPALARPSPAQPALRGAVVDGAPAVTRFTCQDGGDLLAAFGRRDATLVAVVDPGDGPHALPLSPWTGGPPVLTWTDGRRTLTWSPGVHIMWTDGDGGHRMCGREHRH